MKRTYSIIFLPLFLALTALLACTGTTGQSNAAGNGSPAGQLFIIGGGSRPPQMIQEMIKASGLDQGGYVVILPMASAEPDSAIIWSGEQFAEAGLENVAGFNFSASEPPGEARLDSLRNASLIYISGGSQSRFMDIVGGTPIEEAIKEAFRNGAMIAGTSAGAAVMSQKMITGDELRHPEYRSTYAVIEAENIDLAEGLGLIDNAIIDQHFVWRSRHNRLITAVLEYPDLPGIGIDESTAILVKGDTARVVGESQVLVYRNPKASRSVVNHKMGGQQLVLDVYLPGDKFSIH